MPSVDDLITISQAVEQYGQSRPWWFTQIKSGGLTAYEQRGMRETFLSRREVEAYLAPRPKKRPDTSESGDTGTVAG